LARQDGMAWAAADQVLNGEALAPGIDDALGQLEGVAVRSGVALGLAPVYPVTLDRIAAWAGTLEGKNLVLAPVTAVVSRQPAS
jgi:polysaccharide deacetylase 2 family uncharacterized protein YibQ